MKGTQEINEPWIDPEDKLDRKQYADFLTKVMLAKSPPYTLNLNADWGAGKTFFIKNWAKDLGEIHPTVYVNAWESDYTDNPLVAVVSSIIDQLSKQLNDTQEAKQAAEKFIKSAGRILKGIAPILVKAAVTKVVGNDAVGDLEGLGDDNNALLSNLAEQSTRLLIKDHQEKKAAIDSIHSDLTDIINCITRKKEAEAEKPIKPLFVFIDELDRCRPTYAIELLETVKHIFYHGDIIFIVATDSGQLQHSIKSIYGENFDGSDYLRRFFDQEYRLPLPDYLKFSIFLFQSFKEFNKVNYAAFRPWCRDGNYPANPEEFIGLVSLSEMFSFFSEYFHLSLRTMIQCYDRIVSIVNYSSKNLDITFLIILVMLHAKHPDLFISISDNVAKGASMDEKLTSNLPSSNSTVQWYFGDFGESVEQDMNPQQIIVKYINAASSYLSLGRSNDRLPSSPNGALKLSKYLEKQNIDVKLQGNNNNIVPLPDYIHIVNLAGGLS